MTAAAIVEAIDVLEDGSFGVPPRRPFLSPDQFGFQRFEEGFDGGIIVTVTLAAHRWPQAIGL